MTLSKSALRVISRASVVLDFANLLMKTRSKVIALHLVNECCIDEIWKRCAILFLLTLKYKRIQDVIFCTRAFRVNNNLTTWIARLHTSNTSDLNTCHTQLFQILVQALINIGSGVNYKRRGLQTILDACIQRTIGEVVVAHRDRLARFSFDLIESIVQKAGGKITVLADTTGKTGEQDLAEDLLSIVQIHCCGQMGRRKYKKSEAGNPPHTATEETNGAMV